MLILFCRFVIASAGHGKNPLQKRVMTIQVAVIARNEAIQKSQTIKELQNLSLVGRKPEAIH